MQCRISHSQPQLVVEVPVLLGVLSGNGLHLLGHIFSDLICFWMLLLQPQVGEHSQAAPFPGLVLGIERTWCQGNTFLAQEREGLLGRLKD